MAHSARTTQIEECMVKCMSLRGLAGSGKLRVAEKKERSRSEMQTRKEEEEGKEKKRLNR